MKTGLIIAGIVLIAAIVFGVYMVDVDVADMGSAPDVDVSVEGGEMPEINAEVGDIETGTEEVTVTVPTVDVQTPEEENASN